MPQRSCVCPSPLDIERRAGYLFSRASERRPFASASFPLMSPSSSSDALRGSVELLILKTLSLGPQHGWGIGQRVQQISGGELELGQGSLYPALQRLEQKGWITSEWQRSENQRRARYYSITPAGRRALGEEIQSWRRFAATLEQVLRTS